MNNGVIGLNGIGVFIDGREIDEGEDVSARVDVEGSEDEEGSWKVEWKICLESVCDMRMMNDSVEDIGFVRSVSVNEEKLNESLIRIRSLDEYQSNNGEISTHLPISTSPHRVSLPLPVFYSYTKASSEVQ